MQIQTRKSRRTQKPAKPKVRDLTGEWKELIDIDETEEEVFSVREV